MKAVSLNQPWASLLVTHQLCDCWHCRNDVAECPPPPQPMVKRFETRSWPFPPALIGQLIAFHATKRDPYKVKSDYDWPKVGDWHLDWEPPGFTMWHDRNQRDDGRSIRLPLGAIVGSGRITASIPIVHNTHVPKGCCVVRYDDGGLFLSNPGWHDISDQLLYGNFTPDRYAWQIEDAATTNERCPWCQGTGCEFNLCDGYCKNHADCPVCDGAGRCDPIPARGHQRIWSWQP